MEADARVLFGYNAATIRYWRPVASPENVTDIQGLLPRNARWLTTVVGKTRLNASASSIGASLALMLFALLIPDMLHPIVITFSDPQPATQTPFVLRNPRTVDRLASTATKCPETLHSGETRPPS